MLRRPALCCALISASACLLPAAIVHADVFGRLRFTVRDTAGKPMQGANIIFHDTAGVNPDFNVVTDANGTALSPPLEIRPWRVTTQIVTYDTDTRTLPVIADTTTDVSIVLTKRVVSTTVRGITIPRNSNTANSTRIDPRGPRQLNTIGNPQSLRNLLITTPGINFDSNGQAHPREDHSNTSTYIYGVKLPQAFQGRIGQVLLPESVQSIDVQTGGYAPEYGGETAAILNIVPRFGTIVPTRSFYLDGGEFSTFDQSVTAGGQIGAATDGSAGAHPISYFLDLSNRSTAATVETPQPNNQTAHNGSRSQSAFGNIGYKIGSNDQLDLLLEDAPASSQIANRNGVGDYFQPVGQGYGFGGARDADGTIPNADPTLLGGGTDVLPSQQSAGQDAYQHDENQFSVLNLRHTFSRTLTSLFSAGFIRSRLDIRNSNPNQNPDLGNLPVDSSIEYNPTILKTSGDSQYSASLTDVVGAHTLKGGLLIDQQSGRESYRLEPGSQLAVDALASGDPALLPGNGTSPMDASGNPILDALGNPVYTLPAGTQAITVNLNRSGYYNALYAQDTWRVSRQLYADYGLRYDRYYQRQNFLGTSLTEKKDYLSPRVNLAYAFTPSTILRLSYNKLFAQPPLAQGGLVGQNVLPETYDDYNASIERQVASNQSVKLAYYYKNITNQIDTNILIPATQFGVYTSINFPKDGAHGIELSYDLAPRGGVGLGGYLAYSNSISKPEGLIVGTTTPVPPYNDHDITNTLSTGLDYTFRSGALIGASVYHSSGPQSSILGQYYPLGAPGLLDNGHRQAHTEVNLRLATSPRLIGAGPRGGIGFGLDVQNIFNSRRPENFNSGFSGTRFQLGRRILLNVTGGF